MILVVFVMVVLKLESLDHIFFNCDFSKEIWRNILGVMSINYRDQPWKEYIERISKNWKGNKLKIILEKMSLGSTMY